MIAPCLPCIYATGRVRSAVAYMLVTSLLSFIGLFSGCATVGTPQEPIAKAGVQYATLKVIDGDADRARRVEEIVGLAMDSLSGETASSLSVLESVARENIDWSKLDVADTILVTTLISAIVSELSRRLDAPDVLPPDEALVVSEVLSWVSDAAALAYSTSPSAAYGR